MKKILILAEGFTEKRFIDDILKPFFEQYDIFVQSRNLKGISKYEIVKLETLKLLKDSSADLVTTMIDFYRCPKDFPSKNMVQNITKSIEKVKILEDAFGADINNQKFLPYLQLHEFEALLFCNIEAFKFATNQQKRELQEISKSFINPEDINEHPNTAPSKRIKDKIPNYTKDIHGIIAAKEIGIVVMMAKCDHFKSWIEALKTC